MGVEIERKFLVNWEKWKAIVTDTGQYYRQGYISTDPTKTVRVRLTDTAGYLTIKGLSVGASRAEYEYAIPVQDAKELLDHFCSSVIEKYRFKVYEGSHLWEVDHFVGENEGLLIAEIELTSEQESFDLPDWVEQEVTGQEKYYNAYLSNHPYKNWS